MAIDNLNYYSSWLPAGQQTDKYSSQPWCLKSKNLDIFSSSKSVKATAWSEPTTTDSDVIKQEWKLVLKTDWKVYERDNGVDTLVVDPSANFPVYQVSYNWKNGTYEDATWGTVQDMSAIYEWDELKSFVVFTDRASYNYSAVKYVLNKKIWLQSMEATHDEERASDYWFSWYWYTHSSGNSSAITITVEDAPFTHIPLWLYAHQDNNSDTNISIAYIKHRAYKYYYDAQLDGIMPSQDFTNVDIAYTGSLTDWFYLDLPVNPVYWTRNVYEIGFSYTKKEWASTWHWSGDVCVDLNLPNDPSMNGDISDWDYNEYYSYLPIRERTLVNVWDYGYSESYWMKGQTFQSLYKWVSSWEDVNWEKKTRYDFITDMWWENDPWMDVIWMTVWNEQVYMIWNLDWNWYIIPCDLSGGRWTPFIAYGCTFKWVTNIDYLMYLVWDDRWVSTLWVFNQQELVAIIGWSEEKDTKNLIDNSEQYRFDWKMIEYRWDLILLTTDNRIFAYWQTFGGKGWVFIHQLPWTIKELKADWKDLSVKYTVSSTDYVTTLQDDKPIRNYNTEWMAEYPIVIWNHLLEKEESDLYASYILPSASCKLEFWGMANHYHFWTFTSSDSYTFSTTASYKMKGCTWNYVLKYIETNGNQYTFRLEWDLPVQTTNDMKITDSNNVDVITYSDFNHFRKIWEITTDKYCEWEFRFHNLNNKLELPKSYSLQIMVKGKGTVNYTPELFALDLVANQRERW